MNITLMVTASPELMTILQAIANGFKLTTAPKTSTNGAVTIEAVRAAVKAKADAGKKDQVKALLSEFGADKVTALAKEQYTDFLQKVEAL